MQDAASARDVLVLMPCGGDKLDRPAWLLDLYRGPMWQTLRTHLGDIPTRNVYVLSAKLGLRSVLEIHPPYDLRMTSAAADRFIALGLDTRPCIRRNHILIPIGPSVRETLTRWCDGSLDVDPWKAVIVAGAGEYRRVMDYLVSALKQDGLLAAEAPVLTVSGGIGEQRSQLAAHLKSFRSTHPEDETRDQPEDNEASSHFRF